MNKIEKINLVFHQDLFDNANRNICFLPANKQARKKQKSLFPNVFLNGIALMIILLISSCSPQSKESYLEDYEEFISEVSKENNGYTEQDWEKADEKYEKFTGKWYEKFEDEFTWKEQLVIKKNEFQYNLIKIKDNSFDFFNTYIKEDYEQLKEQIKYYSENEMNEDIEYILEQANEMGESATKTVEDILKELNIELEELHNK